jgi:hypothetical protein
MPGVMNDNYWPSRRRGSGISAADRSDDGLQSYSRHGNSVVRRLIVDWRKGDWQSALITRRLNISVTGVVVVESVG